MKNDRKKNTGDTFMIPIFYFLCFHSVLEMKSFSCVKWGNINKIRIDPSPLFCDKYNLKSNCKGIHMLVVLSILKAFKTIQNMV